MEGDWDIYCVTVKTDVPLQLINKISLCFVEPNVLVFCVFSLSVGSSQGPRQPFACYTRGMFVMP